jgi:hypothetical protein
MLADRLLPASDASDPAVAWDPLEGPRRAGQRHADVGPIALGLAGKLRRPVIADVDREAAERAATRHAAFGSSAAAVGARRGLVSVGDCCARWTGAG